MSGGTAAAGTVAAGTAAAGTAAAGTAAATAATAASAGAAASTFSMASLLPYLSAASIASSAIGAVSQSKAASASAKYNAQVQANNATIAQNNATLAGQEGAANAAIEQQKTRANVGAIKAAQSANGVDVNSKSSLDVRSSAAQLGELNAITIRSNAARDAYRYQTAASGSTAQSELNKSEAKSDTAAGYIDAGSTILGGVVKGSKSGLWDSFNESKGL